MSQVTFVASQRSYGTPDQDDDLNTLVLENLAILQQSMNAPDSMTAFKRTLLPNQPEWQSMTPEQRKLNAYKKLTSLEVDLASCVLAKRHIRHPDFTTWKNLKYDLQTGLQAIASPKKTT